MQTTIAADPKYPREVAQWQEVSVPPETDRDAHRVWLYAANYSDKTWRVFVERDRICAQLTTEPSERQQERPKFTPKTDRFTDASIFAHVDDGWLVAFNEGEFGAALYWFSLDGKHSYEVSHHQVVDFFVLPDGRLYAIEGLSHMAIDEGSIIKITRSEPTGRWQASTVTRLPGAPYAISVRRDGTMFVVLSDALVSISARYEINTLLLPNAPWGSGGLYPDSSVLSPDEQKLYIGMRQFVGEFDIATKKLRLLIPSDAFLNKLSREDERRIRQYGD